MGTILIFRHLILEPANEANCKTDLSARSFDSNEVLMMNSFWKRFGIVLAASILVVAGTSISSQGQTQNQPPAPALSRADEMLKAWNAIGNKLIAMAQDFPEDKYDFKLQKDERTFALNLLHAAALDYVLIRRISGSNLGPDFGEGDNPSRDDFKTKADVAAVICRSENPLIALPQKADRPCLC